MSFIVLLIFQGKESNMVEMQTNALDCINKTVVNSKRNVLPSSLDRP